jgi:NAD+ kinase
METQARPKRVALVVHPTRPVTAALARLERWLAENDLEIVRSDPEEGDLVVALGGDGTVLAALRRAEPVGAPVLGVACGSVGVLAAVTAEDLEDALAHVRAGTWTPYPLPALAIESGDGAAEWAVNDFVAVRRGPGQLVANVSVDGELYVRIAGDGLVVATPLGSSAYSMAAGGPVLAQRTPAFVCTPVAMHGGNAPPLVVPASARIRVELQPGFAGYDVEIDGHNSPSPALDYTITLTEQKVTLVSIADRPLGLTRLREKHLINDSARILARDARGDQPGRKPS